MTTRHAAAIITPIPPHLSGILTQLAVFDDELPAGNKSQPFSVAPMVVQITRHGRATVTVNGAAPEHVHGRVIILSPDSVITEHVAALSSWRVCYSVVEGPWVDMLRPAFDHLPGRTWSTPRPMRRLRQLVESVVIEPLTRAHGWEWRLAAALADLCAVLDVSRANSSSRNVVDDVGRLVDDAPDRAWSVTALARAVGQSRSRFAQRFFADTCETPARWVRRRRCEHARHLLLRGISVLTTAELVGFTDQFHFSRTYHTVMGHPPSCS